MDIDFKNPHEKEKFVSLLATAVCQTHLARSSMRIGNDGDALARYFAVDRHEAVQALKMLPKDLFDEIVAEASANEEDPPGK